MDRARDTLMARGGRRPGAGRKPGRQPGVTNIATREAQAMHAKVLAQQARRSWADAVKANKDDPKRNPHPGPRPSRDDVEAATAFVDKLLVRCALRGEGRAAVHLDERLHGRVKYAVEHGGIPDGDPIPVAAAVAVAGAASVEYVCDVPRPRRPPADPPA